MMLIVYIVVIIFIAVVLLLRGKASVKNSLLFSLLSFLTILAALDSLGTSKPFWMEWRKEIAVVHAQYYPNEHIYIWLEGPDPVAYRLPWDEKIAKELQQGLRMSKKLGLKQVRMKRGTPYGSFATKPPIRLRPEFEKPGSIIQ